VLRPPGFKISFEMLLCFGSHMLLELMLLLSLYAKIESGTPGSKRRDGKKRGTRGKLRRKQEISNVLVEDTFQLKLPEHVAASSEQDRKASEGCYISTTVHNRRYYGVLIDQTSLKRASLLYFQDEASGLDLNRKMEYLIRKQHLESGGDLSLLGDLKRSAEDDVDSEHPFKKPRLSSFAVPDSVESSSKAASWMESTDESQLRQIQKFRYVMPDTAKAKSEPGYRLLLATYADADAAAEDDPEKVVAIESACGNFVGDYYYQYEVRSNHERGARMKTLPIANLVLLSLL
jgi:hypothetical protein